MVEGTLLAKNPARQPDLFFTAEGLAAYVREATFWVPRSVTVEQHLAIEDWVRRPSIRISSETLW